MERCSEYNIEDNDANSCVCNSMPIDLLVIGRRPQLNRPRELLGATDHGGIMGDPTKPAICVQSKVMGNNDNPVVPPNSWFITGLCGNIQVAKAKTLKHCAKKPGMK